MTLIPTEDQYQAFSDHTHTGPIWMPNLLRFTEGGEALYARYLEAVRPLVETRGGRIVFRSRGLGTLIGPDQWDEMLIVMYPSRDVLIEMIESDEYQAIMHLRVDALVDSRIYMTTELPIP